ncbi:MAG: class I SAM-dependent methyltransferase [Methylocystis sp.]|nr:class I SAM-dependent methyltransferase [Methylocystis sp.]
MIHSHSWTTFHIITGINSVPYLIDGCAAAHPAHILELAASTGAVKRKSRDLPPRAAIAATDPDGLTLAAATTKFPLEEYVAFKVADAVALPFAEGAFDA